MSNKLPEYVKGQIYVIKCLVNGKKYVGQTHSHRLTGRKREYKPFGYIGRWEEHAWEAEDNTKKTQCTLLNNAIRAHGRENFKCKLIHVCKPSFLDYFERMYIHLKNTFGETGYNLNAGGFGGRLARSAYERISNTNIEKSMQIREALVQSLEISKIEIKDFERASAEDMIVLDIHVKDHNNVRYTFYCNVENYEDSFARAYNLIKAKVEPNNIYVHNRVQLKLKEHVKNYEFNQEEFTSIKNNRTMNTHGLRGIQKKFDRYKNYRITKITLKKRRKKDINKVAVCIKSPDKTRDIVCEFGGHGIEYLDAYVQAVELAEMLQNNLPESDSVSYTVTDELKNIIQKLKSE